MITVHACAIMSRMPTDMHPMRKQHSGMETPEDIEDCIGLWHCLCYIVCATFEYVAASGPDCMRNSLEVLTTWLLIGQ